MSHKPHVNIGVIGHGATALTAAITSTLAASGHKGASPVIIDASLDESAKALLEEIQKMDTSEKAHEELQERLKNEFKERTGKDVSQVLVIRCEPRGKSMPTLPPDFYKPATYKAPTNEPWYVQFGKKKKSRHERKHHR